MDWNRLAALPDYQNAAPEQQRRIQDSYFNDFIQPEVVKDGGDVEAIRQQFYTAVRGSTFNTLEQAFEGAAPAPKMEWLSQVATPERVSSLESLGPMGVGETWEKLNKWNLLPYLNGVAVVEDVQVLNTIKKIQAGEVVTQEESYQAREYVSDMIELEARGTTIGAGIISTLVQMPAFAIEFATSGGAVTAVRKAAGVATREAVGGVVRRTAGVAADAAARTALMPHRIVGAYADRAIGESVAVTEEGQVIFQEAKTAPATAAMKAFGDVWVEAASERFGDVFGAPLNRVTGRASRAVLPKKLVDRMVEVVESVTGQGFVEAAKKFGYNGLLAEIGEERLADVMRYGLGLDENAEKPYSFEDFIGAVVPDRDEFLVEVGAIAMFGTASRVGHGLGQRLMRKGYTPEQARNVVENMTVTEQRKMLADMVAKDGQRAVDPMAPIREAGPDTTADQAVNDINAALDALSTLTVEDRAELAQRVQQAGLSSVVRERITKLEEDLAREYTGQTNLPLPARVEAMQAELARLESVAPQVFTEAKAKRVIAQAERIATRDVTAAREVLSDYITSSKIPDSVKTKELAALNRVTSSQQAKTRFKRIHARVTAAAEKQLVTDGRAEIKKALGKVKVTMTAGRRRSNVDAPTAKRTSQLKAIAKLSKEKAAALYEGGTLKDDPLAQAVAAATAGEGYASPGLINGALDAINEMVATGRAARADIKAQREEALAKTMADVSKALGTPLAKGRGRVAKALKEDLPRGLLGWFGVWRLRWLQAFQSSDGDLVRRLTDEDLSLFEENLRYDIGRKQEIRRATDIMLRQTGMSEKDLMKKLWRDETGPVRIADGTPLLHADGVRRPISLTRGQMRYLWVQSRNSTGRAALLSEKGNRYTPDILSTIENEMTPEDVAIAKAMAEFYEGYFPKVNSFVERTQGVSLRQEQFYSPLMRESANEEVEGFLEATLFFQKRSPRAVKERTGGDAPIKLLSDFSTLVSHISEMEYYMNIGEKAAVLERLVTNHDIAQQIRDVAGEGLLKDLQKDARYFATRGRHEQQFVSTTMNTLVRNFQASVLWAKPQIGLKQVVGFPAFAQGVESKDFMQGLAALAANPLKARDVLRQSAFLQDRFGSLEALDRAFSDLASDRSALNVLGSRPKLRQILALPIQYGDAAAISIGGYAHYYAKRKAGASHTEALRSMELVAVRTQQSSQIGELAALQREPNFAARLMTNFLSAPNALARAEYEALVEGMRGRITKGEAAKRLFIYHVLIPNMFTWVANGFTIDEEDHLQASILGSVNGIFLIGAMIEALASWAIKDELWELNQRHPLEFATEFMKAAKQFNREDADFGDVMDGMKAMNTALKATGALFGVPLDQAYNMLVGGKKVVQGDVAEGGALMLGYSPWVVENKILADEE